MIGQGIPTWVVDYACPDRSGQWVEEYFPMARVLFVHETPFSIARGRNIGAASVTTPWVLFCDADVLLPDNFVHLLQSELTSRRFVRFMSVGENSKQGTWGLCAVKRSDFLAVQGYDETFSGWGGEDDDLYARLMMSGSEELVLQWPGLQSLPHGDELRTRFYEQKRKVVSFVESRVYRELKYFTMKFYGVKTELPIEARRRLRQLTARAIHNWEQSGCEEFSPVRVSLRSVSSLLPGHDLGLDAKLKISLHKKDSL